MPSRVLLIDDEIGILLAFRRLLERPTLVVDTAETIEEAEELLRTRLYHAVIVDLRMTGVVGTEGLEVIRYVRESSLSVCVILMTGYGSPDVMSRAFEMGADYYFEKPVQVRELEKALLDRGILR